MYDIRSAMLNIGIVFTPGKFKINLEKTWKTPGILVNLRSTDPVDNMLVFKIIFKNNATPQVHIYRYIYIFVMYNESHSWLTFPTQ